MQTKNLKAAVVLILLFAISASAQNPCSKADTARAMAESRLAAARARAETFAARLDEALRELEKLKGQGTSTERELERHKAQAVEAEQRLSAEQKTSASLAGALRDARNQIEDLQKAVAERDKTILADAETLERDRNMIALLSSERAQALLKIEAANSRWMCRRLHIGCIK